MRHDENYRRLFTHKAMIRALLLEHLEAPLTDGLQFEHARLLPSVYIRPDTSRRESDVVWRIPHVSGEPLYLVVLLEFQSSSRPEQPMALRLLQYATLFWERLLQDPKPAAQRLPPILPVVLYNGPGAWRQPTDLHALVFGEQARSSYQRYCPQVRYVLLDINALDASLLNDKQDPASLLMRFERAETLEQFEALLRVAVKHLSAQESEELEQVGRSMKVWLAHLARSRDYIDEGSVERILDEQEVGVAMTLLEASMERWKREREEQLEQGIEQGREQGQRELLAMQLELRFGPDATRQERLAALDAEALRAASARILTAQSETQVFEGP